MSSDDVTALPKNYRTVLAVIDGAGPGSHLTAHDIWRRAREMQPRIGFATVHRALARLHVRGDVMKVDVPGAASTIYEPAAEPHAHFRCSACGTIADVDYAVPAPTLRELARRHGIAIEREEVIFTGRCATCA